MPSKRVLVGSVAGLAVLVAASGFAVAAGGDSRSSKPRHESLSAAPWTTATAVRDLHAKFPLLGPPGDGDVGRLPSGNSRVVAVGTASGIEGADVLVAATDSRQLCFEMNQSGTCQPAELVLSQGMFIIAMDCAATPVSAQVMGVVPAGVAHVALVGAPTVGGAPSPSGVVSFSVPGGRVPGLALDNGKVNPLRVDPSDCRQTGR